MTYYQALLLSPARITFQVPAPLNPATLLPEPDLDAPLHDCARILAHVYGTRPDLKETLLPDAERIWFTDGSSFIQDGQKYAGAAVMSLTDIIWAEPLPTSTSAKRAELITLTKALGLGKDKKPNVYACAAAHIHGTIY